MNGGFRTRRVLGTVSETPLVRRPVITLTTDFGLKDHYVAAVKASVLNVNPDAAIVDISHAIQPQDVEQAAFLLACSYAYFPRGSIHVVVVDPGVGTQRHGLALETEDYVFVGPDNGVLSAALPDSVRETSDDRRPLPVALPKSLQARWITNSRYHRLPVSPTFHARDIFGPVAGHLSLNVAISEFGPELTELIALRPFRAEPKPDGSLEGRVVHIDRFGNLITTIRADQLPSAATVNVAGRVISGLSPTYAEASGPAALIGSCGYLEIAVTNRSAERELGVGRGDLVIVQPA
jgi:S-adenosylmethionine hydrolase